MQTEENPVILCLTLEKDAHAFSEALVKGREKYESIIRYYWLDKEASAKENRQLGRLASCKL